MMDHSVCRSGFGSGFGRLCCIGDIVCAMLLIAGRYVLAICVVVCALVVSVVCGAGRVWAVAGEMASSSTVVANNSAG